METNFNKELFVKLYIANEYNLQFTKTVYNRLVNDSFFKNLYDGGAPTAQEAQESAPEKVVRHFIILSSHTKMTVRPKWKVTYADLSNGKLLREDYFSTRIEATEAAKEYNDDRNPKYSNWTAQVSPKMVNVYERISDPLKDFFQN